VRSSVVRAIFDASVFGRALVDRQADARRWVERLDRREADVVVPELVFAETGHTLARHVRAGLLTHGGAVARLDFVRRLPLELRPLDLLATPALIFALERGLSVYDSFYGVLAEVEDAVLVTADRRLAAAVERSELVA
jgi:predicted nucleic acid-binding protein